MTCAWQVEIDPYCQRVLKKHWPEVPKHDDIRTFEPTSVDVICGGFPCQDISLAGKGKGIEGEKSGLWNEFYRIISDIRPQYIIVENSSQLCRRGLPAILGQLSAVGYDAEWAVLPATSIGALHIRARLFVVAYPKRIGRHGIHEWVEAGRVEADPQFGSTNVPNRPSSGHKETFFGPFARWCEDARATIGVEQWGTEPSVGRVANGVPHRVDRRRGIGNAVVPQIAEWIGRRLMEFAV